jgi:hypothetical protein
MNASIRRMCLGVAVLSITFAGCSPSKIKVNGKILKNGTPLIVSEDTLVTLQFIPDLKGADAFNEAKTFSAKFDQKTGTYSVEMPPGKYKTKFVMANPSKATKDGKLNAPSPPVQSDKVYELTKDQELDIEVPGK